MSSSHHVSEGLIATELADWVARRMDEMFKAASSTADCIRASPYESDLVHSPFKTRLGATMFEYYEQHPEHAARFAKGMAGVASGKSGNPPPPLPSSYGTTMTNRTS